MPTRLPFLSFFGVTRRDVSRRRWAVTLTTGLLSANLGACRPDADQESEVFCATSTTSPAEARLLTRSEYLRTVQDLLETDLDPTASFPPEPVVAGFENDASSHQANPLLVEKHADAAAALVVNLLQKGLPEEFVCAEGGKLDECADNFIDHYGLRAYRRPLTDGERDSLRSLYQRALPTLGHVEAMTAVLEVLLQSPQFLYRVESPISQSQDGMVRLGPYELASRLSYFLWGSMPDPELFRAAERDELKLEGQIEEQARRLLKDRRAQIRARDFHSQWLGLSRLNSIARDDSPENAANSWRESTLRFVDGVLWGSTPTVSELFSSSEFHYDDVLAELYGQDPPGGWTSKPDMDERHGLLTQPGIMALLAHADQSSLIQRGVFVRENILCEEVAPPPPTVDNNPPDPDPNLTTRERFAVHTESPACANCHRVIDPLGFGLEAYDHLGRFRAEENGLPIDTSGEIADVTEAELEGTFVGAAELSERIALSETALSCLAKKWFAFAMGRAHQFEDNCSISVAIDSAAAQDGNLQELLVALCTSDAFRYRPAHESDKEHFDP